MASPAEDLRDSIDTLNQNVTEMRTKSETDFKRVEDRVTDFDTRFGNCDAAVKEFLGEEYENAKQWREDIADLQAKTKRLEMRVAVGHAPEDHEKALDANDPRETKGYQKLVEKLWRFGKEVMEPSDWRVLTCVDPPPGVDVKGSIWTEFKALSTDLSPAGGYVAPPTFDRNIRARVLELGMFENQAERQTIGTGRYEYLLETDNQQTILVIGERETHAESTEEDLWRLKAIDVYEFYAEPAVTATMLEDGFFDVGGHLERSAGFTFAQKRGVHFIKGTGNGEPEGLMVSSEPGTTNSGLATTFTMANLRNLPQDIKGPYTQNGSYGFSRTALTTLMNFRTDSGAGANTGPFMWEPSAQDGRPSRLRGYTWWEDINLDAVAANAFPVVFGDFMQAYIVVNRRGLRVIRDEVTASGRVKFKMSQRYGGGVSKGEAVQKLKCST